MDYQFSLEKPEGGTQTHAQTQSLPLKIDVNVVS